MNGIDVSYDAEGNTISNNEIIDNNGDGINIWTSSSLEISDNTISENNGDGMALVYDSDGHTMEHMAFTFKMIVKVIPLLRMILKDTPMLIYLFHLQITRYTITT